MLSTPRFNSRFRDANNESSEVCGHLLPLECDLFNLTFRPGLIMPQTFDDSVFASGMLCSARTKEATSSQ